MMKSLQTLLLSLLSIFVVVSCRGSDSNAENPPVDRISRLSEVVVSEKLAFRIDTLYDGLENPWGMTWLPDGRMLINERKGEILIFENDQYTGRKLEGVPATYTRGQSGLLDIQLHPNYDENGWIYATYAKPATGGGSTTLIRFQLDGDQVVDLEELYQTQPITNAGVHFGSRIIFDNHHDVYFSTGDRGVKENSQDLTNDMGKILRLHDDGRVPADNPFVNHDDARPAIWSYGHRNVQGMAYDQENDRLYATEHGPRGGDELNLVEKGKNYGWPVITYGINYSGTIISELTHKEGMEQPVHYWTPSIATCGLLLYKGDRYPAWNGNLFSGSLVLTHLARVELNGARYSHEEKLLEGIGRLRHVAQSPDDYMYILTEGPGMVLKLIPNDQ